MLLAISIMRFNEHNELQQGYIARDRVVINERPDIEYSDILIIFRSLHFALHYSTDYNCSLIYINQISLNNIITLLN